MQKNCSISFANNPLLIKINIRIGEIRSLQSNFCSNVCCRYDCERNDDGLRRNFCIISCIFLCKGKKKTAISCVLRGMRKVKSYMIGIQQRICGALSKKKNVKIKYALRFAVKVRCLYMNMVFRRVALGEKCVKLYIHASMTVKRRTQYAISVIICDLCCFFVISDFVMRKKMSNNYVKYTHSLIAIIKTNTLQRT